MAFFVAVGLAALAGFFSSLATAAVAAFLVSSTASTRCFWPSSRSAAGKAFVDLQHDVVRSDIDLAYREGFVSVEHLKRYTTLGMAADQGKLSSVSGLARMAELRQVDIPDVGTTRFRPPYTPVAIGANCGIGPGDAVAAAFDITGVSADIPVITKANCGVPLYKSDAPEYPVGPEGMADYVELATRSGARVR